MKIYRLAMKGGIRSPFQPTDELQPEEESDTDEEDPENRRVRVYTCLSTDIINHEFGHAVLDGIRPYYFESSLVETAAFHEFIGDLTAILIILRNNEFRNHLADTTKGDLSGSSHLSRIAEQFGKTVGDEPYLRTALNRRTMSEYCGLIHRAKCPSPSSMS